MENKVVVETLDEFDFTPDPRSRRSQYDWDTLFDGQIHKVVGVSKTFEMTVQRNAEKHGLTRDDDAGYRLKRLDDETVVIQATK